MRSLLKFVACLCVLHFFAGVPQLHAQWMENGTLVCGSTNDQETPVIVSDGMGGAIIAWKDMRSGTNYDIYAQRVSVSGVPMWGAGGVAICTEGSDQEDVRIAADGHGGAVIAWVDKRGTDKDIFAQRINASGSVMWYINGVSICYTTGIQAKVQIISDGYSGAIITWHDDRSGDNDIYAQRVAAGGYTMWSYNGEVVSAVASTMEAVPQLVTDGEGGAIVAWADMRNGNLDIYAQHMQSDGVAEWTANGVPVCRAAFDQEAVQITSDNLGGAIITWDDYRTGTNYDIYAQRVVSSGARVWTMDGEAICTESGMQTMPAIATDDLGGAIIAWNDSRTSFNGGIYAQRIDATGTPLWAADGVSIADGPGMRYDAELIPDCSGGTIIVWNDNENIYAQLIDAAGATHWTAEGEPICIAPYGQNGPQICINGAGGAIMTWEDERGAADDIYASPIEADGRLYYPAPSIFDVRDVPGDQGGSVYLSWNASREDIYEGDLLTDYTIWRAIDPASALAMIERGEARLVNRPADALDAAGGNGIDWSRTTAIEEPGTDRPVVRRRLFAGEPYYWELVGSRDAMYRETYGMTVATLFDSTAGSDEMHYFQVVAQTADPAIYWESDPDSGYSVDNIAPCPPAALAGEQMFIPEGLMLTWDPSTDVDLDNYNIYRGTVESFVPGPGNLLASPCDTFYFDGGWTWESSYWYKVSAVDIHGNESPFAVLGPDGVVGEDDREIPNVNFLAQNYPNPFNPVTTIRFGLERPARVRISVYDAAGRFVSTLLDERRSAGPHTVEWDGRDAFGRAMASGVYFYSLAADPFNETKKMVLLR